MTDVSVTAMAEAFGLAEPVGPAHLMRQRGQVAAWRISTGSGQMLIKRFWADDNLPWQDELEIAMQIEQQALAAGIATPTPLTPVRPIFGSVARIEGQGLFRAFPYVEHRPLADDDDVAEWIGTTLALTHGLLLLDGRPSPNWWYCQFPPVPPEQWSRWLDGGESVGAAWARSLRSHLDLVLEQTATVVATFDTSPPYAFSHRDFESWNVLMSDSGPQLIDWDTAGAESVPLEAAYVLTRFAVRGRQVPDQQLLDRSHRAYVAAGGTPLTAKPGLLDRMIGTQLAKIADALGRVAETQDDELRIRDRIEGLPATVENARSWERLFG